MTGFVFLRVRAHRLLLCAAVLAVLLTTSVLAALTAFSGSVGDAALRNALTHRSAADASFVVSAQVPPDRREAADAVARKAAGAAFDGLPVTVRTLETSGAYALPTGLRAPSLRSDDPDLAHFAALDRSRVRITSGRAPAPDGGADGGPVEAALPLPAAKALKLEPGARFTVTDRLTDKPLPVLVTGVYEVADPADPYWQLDELGGRGVRRLAFTTYGPLLTGAAVPGSGRVSAGTMSWLASADFRTVTTGRIDGLRASAEAAPKRVTSAPEFKSGASARTSLPRVLEQIDRALLVSRSTLMIVAVQLVLLAGYALLLVARLLSSERAGETRLLRARGGSRGRITALAAIEALLLALPAALVAPLLAGPLTRLLADRGALARVGVRIEAGATGAVWLVSVGVALACALAVVAPALSAGAGDRPAGRAASLPGPLRAGADIGLLVIAGVAYWQLDRRASELGGGVLSGDRRGDLGIDPLLVAAPALLLLAGTVLTLRLLPPAARLAERAAAGGRGLIAALSGWQFSRRPLRGAGPVLLLVLAVAMGMLAVGQRASWDRSQSDQADFRTGASLRVLTGVQDDPAAAVGYARLPGVRDAAPALRAETELSDARTATVLALDTAHAPDRMLIRDDLTDQPRQRLFEPLAAPRPARTGLPLPGRSTRFRFDARITTDAKHRATGDDPVLSVLVEDGYGLPYRVVAGAVPTDGRAHPFTVGVADGADFTVTGFELTGNRPFEGNERHRLTVEGLRATGPDGTGRAVPVPAGFGWRAALSGTGSGGEPAPAEPLTASASADRPLTVGYDITYAPNDWDSTPAYSMRVTAPRPKPPVPNALATDAYLKAAGARKGQVVDVTLAGEKVRVKIADTVRQLPTTGVGMESSAPVAARDGGALLIDLRALGQVFAQRPGAVLTANEWWLATAPGRTAEAAAALRARPDSEPARILVRDEIARELTGDPLGAGPQSALPAMAVTAAALAAVGFAVSAVGAQRERNGEFAVLRALGTPRRRLTRMIAVEQGVLITIALLVGTVLGTVLNRAVVPLVVLTGQATAPVPGVLVRLPAGQTAMLLAGVAVLPLLTVVFLALRGIDTVTSLRVQGDS
ncbi:FtsX-like permease family protein [Streptomyces sp. NPDC015144]|uniref:FtsX-like permease family protein n=1 Tax=Streptomyces sp. NPDC015144 TaxID=3364944 RepID=UPI0036F92C93